MCADANLDLPPLILLETFNGDWEKYFEAVYNAFKVDFVDNKLFFRDKEVRLKFHPYTDGKEANFYHLTHEGEDEKDRKPDLRRMERIKWPKILIENSMHQYLKVWHKEQKRKKRILIWHENAKYLLVIEDRKNYVLAWTAYCVTKPHRIKKLKKEYNEYIKTKTAQQ